MKTILVIAVSLVVSVSNAAAQQTSAAQKQESQASPAACPMHDAHSQMNERGDKGMGFSQAATKHHFFLRADGGVIQVEASDSADVHSRNEVRMHLEHIARAFQNGDFDIPMFVHDTVPPGVAEMKQLQQEIRYTFEESAGGGRVVISSSDKSAVAAIHNFLRFQIEEHKTGDASEVR
ncbi:MAG TPA: hypothetical protein VN881_03635 [Candidatus Acidoferrales bacterium]|nr:hypothetical protein [Candidatus Acidoferrales bacterium]